MSDPVSELQHGMNMVSHMLFNFIGQAYRDAPPMRIGDNPAEKVPETAFNTQEDSRVKADQLMGGFKHLDTLIQGLPDNLGSESQQLQELEDLRKQNEELQQQLDQECERAERKLQVAQDLFGTLALATLQQRQGQKLQQLKAEFSQVQ
jgi:hypothetical protein